MAGNRVGKTEGGGGYELTLHLTGLYPHWWKGKVFKRSIDAWCAGDTKETVRDIIQGKLMGKTESEFGTGLIPKECIIEYKFRPNGNGSLDYVKVKHASGGVSVLGFKAYEQGRESFQGTEKDVIWLDEESKEGIRSECIMRLMTTGGLLIETFTPLKGITPIVLKYMQEGKIEDSRVTFQDDRAMVMAGWNDVPHLSDDEKKRMLAECEPYLVDARSRGVPSLGAGAIYPIPESDISVPDFVISDHWIRVFAMDVGWNNTACLWAAQDPNTDVWYIYANYKRGQAEPSIHAQAIKEHGNWIPGVIDPAARGRSQKDGTSLIETYIDLGLNLMPSENAVEAGINLVYNLLSTGMLKVFTSCVQFWQEFRLYRRDEKGKIIKVDDHLMDCMKYLILSGRNIAILKPALPKMPIDEYMDYGYISEKSKMMIRHGNKKSGLL